MYRALRNERRALIQQLRGIKTVNGIRLCNSLWTDDTAANAGFQYRKRYSPVQRNMPKCTWLLRLFQYRKRYSPVQPLFDFDEANIS